jgi:hypothetical protein
VSCKTIIGTIFCRGILVGFVIWNSSVKKIPAAQSETTTVNILLIGFQLSTVKKRGEIWKGIINVNKKVNNTGLFLYILENLSLYLTLHFKFH